MSESKLEIKLRKLNKIKIYKKLNLYTSKNLDKKLTGIPTLSLYFSQINCL